MTHLLPDLWLGLSVFGLVLSFLALRQVALDYISARILTNGRKAVAITGFIGESIRATIYLFFAGVGVYYLWNEIELVRPGIGLVMLAALTLLIIKTSIQLWLNHYLFNTSLAHQNMGDILTQDQVEDEHFGGQRRDLEDAHLEEEEKHG